jgi:hypothetical protein
MAKKSTAVLDEEEAPPSKHAHASQEPPPAEADGQSAIAPLPGPGSPEVLTPQGPTQFAAPQLPGVVQGGLKGTHFTGPICSRQGAGAGVPPVTGETPLCLRYFLDNTNVTDYAVQFPMPGSVLWKVLVNTTVAFNGTTPKVNVGSSTGGTSDIASIAPALGTVDTPVTASLPANGKVYLNVTGTSTAGAAQVLFLYFGHPALKWN